MTTIQAGQPYQSGPRVKWRVNSVSSVAEGGTASFGADDAKPSKSAPRPGS